MKSFFLNISFLLFTAAAGAQQLHFVYLQTDSRKPFYALLNNKNYSSSSIGYVILPKLQNGSYTIRIGFPRSEQPEQEFLVQVKDNDQGFLVKDFGDKGWGLFNLQSLDIQYAGKAAEKKNELLAQQKAEAEKLQQEQAADTQRRADSLRAVAQAQKKAVAEAEAAEATLRQQRYNDSVQQATAAAATATLQAQELLAERRRADSTQKANEALQRLREEAEQRRLTDSLQRIADATTNTQQGTNQKNNTDSVNRAKAILLENERLERLADSTAKAQVAAIEKTKQNSTVTSPTGGPVLLQKVFTDTGWRYSYSVNSGSGKEMIDVFIPVGQPQTAIVAMSAPKTSATQSQPSTTTTVATETKKEDDKFLNMEFGNGGSVKMDTVGNGVKVLHNSNCRAAADEKDFIAARKKIVSANDTEKMIATVRKLMKEKCYTTDQVRNLSFLFLTDADRYQFLDAAYPFTLDAYRFGSLQDVLKEDYYIQRFKAMLR